MSQQPFRRLLLITCFSAAACAHAQSPTERAEALLDKGEFLAAERLIESLATAKKPDPVAVWELSRVRTGQHQTEEGVKLAEKAIKLDPSQARFHAQLGAALLAHIGEVERLEQSTLSNRMRKAYEKALSLDPNNLTALLGLSRFYWAPPRRTAAEIATGQALAERAQKIDPFRGAIELGGIAAKKKDLAGALKYFETAAELKPTDFDAQIACGNVLLQLDRRMDARERYENALRISPNSEIAKKFLEVLNTPEPAKK